MPAFFPLPSGCGFRLFTLEVDGRGFEGGVEGVFNGIERQAFGPVIGILGLPSIEPGELERAVSVIAQGVINQPHSLECCGLVGPWSGVRNF